MAKRKIERMRGSQTHGYGAKKKHRGKGSRGGTGLAGLKKHKRVWMIKNMPGHLGKRGFKSMRMRRLRPAVNAINLGDLEGLLKKQGFKGKHIDVKSLGFDKVLGGGSWTLPVAVKSDSFSKNAAEKIEKAKGKVIALKVKKEVKEVEKIEKEPKEKEEGKAEAKGAEEKAEKTEEVEKVDKEAEKKKKAKTE